MALRDDRDRDDRDQVVWRPEYAVSDGEVDAVIDPQRATSADSTEMSKSAATSATVSSPRRATVMDEERVSESNALADT